MKTEIESKKVYVSDDGKEKSYRMEDILKYEKRQLKEIFERRTNIANISTSTTLYLFKKGDIKTFKEFHPEAYLDSIGEDEYERNVVTNTLKELVPEVKKVNIPKSCCVDDWQLFGWLDEHNISLKEFLTNKKYVVIQDGDEYCIWKDLIDCGLIDKKVIENMEDQ